MKGLAGIFFEGFPNSFCAATSAINGGFALCLFLLFFWTCFKFSNQPTFATFVLSCFKTFSSIKALFVFITFISMGSFLLGNRKHQSRLDHRCKTHQQNSSVKVLIIVVPTAFDLTTTETDSAQEEE